MANAQFKRFTIQVLQVDAELVMGSVGLGGFYCYCLIIGA